MSWSLRLAASGFMMGLSRTPERKRRNCSAMYTALWPASRGHSGLTLLPFGPWQDEQTADLVAPSATLPLLNGTPGVAAAAAGVAAGAAGAGAAAAGTAGVCGAPAKAAAIASADIAAPASPVKPTFRVRGIVFFPVCARDRRSGIVHYAGAEAFRPRVRMSRFSAAQFLISAAAPAQFPPDFGAEVAFVGRSNAGKSSAINAITHRHGLARTSKLPGRTRLLNFFELAPGKRLVDLPGYGYASGPESERRAWRPLIDALHARASLHGLFVIVDARRGLASG